MQICPVCFSEIRPEAIKCPNCLSFIKPRINEGQFWGTSLMVAGILFGILSYVWFLARPDSFLLQLMNVGIFLAYMGFLVYGFGTFRSWFGRKQAEEESGEDQGQHKKCFYCGNEIDARAIKCRHCYSYLRQERGKILATFIVVSGILVMTTAYILLLAGKIQSEIYLQIGYFIIILGIGIFLVLVLKSRYSGAYESGGGQQ